MRGLRGEMEGAGAFRECARKAGWPHPDRLIYYLVILSTLQTIWLFYFSDVRFTGLIARPLMGIFDRHLRVANDGTIACNYRLSNAHIARAE